MIILQPRSYTHRETYTHTYTHTHYVVVGNDVGTTIITNKILIRKV